MRGAVVLEDALKPRCRWSLHGYPQRACGAVSMAIAPWLSLRLWQNPRGGSSR